MSKKNKQENSEVTVAESQAKTSKGWSGLKKGSPEYRERDRLDAAARRAVKKAERPEKQTSEEMRHWNRVHADEQERRKKEGKCFFGEVSPGVDANNITDAIQVCREMARALGIFDVQSGETLHDFERRVFDAWATKGGPFLVRQTGALLPGWGKDYWIDWCGGFDATWETLPGGDTVIDNATLPALPEIAKPVEAVAPAIPEAREVTHGAKSCSAGVFRL